MQKIKYPVGSIVETSSGFKLKIIDLSKNEYTCLVVPKEDEKISAYFLNWITQEQLDRQGYTLVSSPRWIPEEEDLYHFYNNWGEIEYKNWNEDYSDEFRLKSGNVFRTYEECQKKIDEINSREI